MCLSANPVMFSVSAHLNRYRLYNWGCNHLHKFKRNILHLLEQMAPCLPYIHTCPTQGNHRGLPLLQVRLNSRLHRFFRLQPVKQRRTILNRLETAVAFPGKINCIHPHAPILADGASKVTHTGQE